MKMTLKGRFIFAVIALLVMVAVLNDCCIRPAHAATRFPTRRPTTRRPTRLPTRVPTRRPTTQRPTTRFPTKRPTTQRPTTRFPTKRPTTQRPTTRFPTKRPTTQRPTTGSPTKRPTTMKPTTGSPTRKQTSSPTTVSIGLGSCPGLPCELPAHCRSEYGYCGGNANSGAPDAWCNEKSTWKAAGCGPMSGTSSPTPVAVTTSSPTTAKPSTSSPVTKSPVTTTSSPTTARPSTSSPSTSRPSTSSPTTARPSTSSPTTASTSATRSPTSATSCTGEPCAISTQCRSQWGYCGGNVNGAGDDYCNALSTWKSTGCGSQPTPTVPPGSTASPTAPTTRSPTSVQVSVADVLQAKKAQVSAQLLISETPQSTWVASTVYKVADLESALRSSISGFAGLSFIGMDAAGKLNLAAFLAQSMKETIRYDVCDENSWDLVNGVYPASNACGQLGQSYQDYTCSVADKHMECPLNSSMEATALTNARWYGAPPPLYGGPKSKTGNLSPGWDASAACGPMGCVEYPGQQGGAWKRDKAYPNSNGRDNVENCVWWGRGVIQVTGRCNFGKVNYFLGKAASDRGVASALYPDVDFCRDPSAICRSTKYPDLKWVTSFYYWMRDVQEYNSGGWNFRTQLAALATTHAGQPTKRRAFIDAISGIVNRGSHTIVADGQAERASNFEKAYAILFSS